MQDLRAAIPTDVRVRESEDLVPRLRVQEQVPEQVWDGAPWRHSMRGSAPSNLGSCHLREDGPPIAPEGTNNS